MQVKGKVVSKTETPIPQPMNGKLLFQDFPIKRTRVHHVYLDTGQHKVVSPEQFEKIKVGDIETVYVSDPPNLKYLLAGIVFFVLVVLLIVYA